MSGRKGAVLLEVVISAIIIAIIMVASLNAYRIGRALFNVSNEPILAANILDSIMTYFENYYTSATGGGVSYGETTYWNTSGNPCNFDYYDRYHGETGPTFIYEVPTSSQANGQMIRLPNRNQILTLLQDPRRGLQQWDIKYSICTTKNQNNTYGERYVLLRLEWYEHGKPDRPENLRTAELGCAFTSRRWSP